MIRVERNVVSMIAHGKEIKIFAGNSNKPLAESICRDWLKMEVVDHPQAEDLAPDLVLYMEGAFDKARAEDFGQRPTPSVVICANALASFQQSSSSQGLERLGVFEFISQP